MILFSRRKREAEALYEKHPDYPFPDKRDAFIAGAMMGISRGYDLGGAVGAPGGRSAIGDTLAAHLPTFIFRGAKCSCGWRSRRESWIGHAADAVVATLSAAEGRDFEHVLQSDPFDLPEAIERLHENARIDSWHHGS